MAKPQVLLSKSKIMAGIQCPKNLWLQINSPEEAEESKLTELIFKQGNEVGKRAQELFKNGVLIRESNLGLAVKATLKAIADGCQTIFEATFMVDGLVARIDILNKTGKGWELIEVKSGVSVKDEYYKDIAIQKYIALRSGVLISKTLLMHLDLKYTHPKGNLFITVDVADFVDPLVSTVPYTTTGLKSMLRRDHAPKMSIGPQCSSPHECPFYRHCKKTEGIPEVSVLDLPMIGKKGFELIKNGFKKLTEAPLENLSPTQRMVAQAHKYNKRFIIKENFKGELLNFKFPLSFLDFETMFPALPIYDGTRPYEQVPFQFSAGVLDSFSSDLKITNYLHDSKTDPRLELTKLLCETIPEEGTVIAYNKSFESRIIISLARLFPQYSAKLISIEERLADPLPLLRGNVYCPTFNIPGSYSLKSVVSLVGESYQGMSIADGNNAQATYLDLLSGVIKEDMQAETRSNLIKYCEHDTVNTYKIVMWLMKEAV